MFEEGMTRRGILKTGLAFGAGAVFGKMLIVDALAQSTRDGGRPNIIFFLADDLGMQVLKMYGGKTTFGMDIKTPNLDALAAGGMRFDHAFACAVCSPTRSQLMTGKYNFRTGFIDIAGRTGAATSLDAQKHPTLPATLKAAGYAAAITGKWHLGECGKFPTPDLVDTNSPHVKECGFDRQYVFPGGHLTKYGQPLPGKYTPDWFHNWAMNFIDGRKGKTEPFFLYYASPIPHTPWMPTPLNPTAAKDPELYASLIEYIDKQVGELIRKLDDLGMRENTLVMFAGDNGCQLGMTSVMADGRTVPGGKRSMLDTATRVPLLANWPGKVPAGSVNENLIDFTDLMPTYLELAGAKAPGALDGVSFAPQLLGQKGNPREWVYVQQVNKYFARDAKWKLREDGTLYDISGPLSVETLVSNPQGQAVDAKNRLQAVLDKLHSKP